MLILRRHQSNALEARQTLDTGIGVRKLRLTRGNLHSEWVALTVRTDQKIKCWEMMIGSTLPQAMPRRIQRWTLPRILGQRLSQRAFFPVRSRGQCLMTLPINWSSL